MFELALDYILFPALAGFMVVGPVLAIGLYEKSRRIADGVPVTLAGMVFVRSRSGGQILFTGVLLSLLMLLWMRAAVLLYALFFGLLPFPGLDDILTVLVTQPAGWALIVVGVRKRVVTGKRGSVRFIPGGRPYIKKQKYKMKTN